MNPLVGVTVPAYEAWNLQYATLTGKAAKDFAPMPGLAESWTESDGGKTWTYKLRPNLKWSDGQPLTAEDIAYTVNRSARRSGSTTRSVTANLTAKAPRPDTVEITSSVPDPKLPVMDVYILPKHIWEKLDAKQSTSTTARTASAAARSCSTSARRASSPASARTRTTGGGKPKVDRVVLRNFNNPDAMVAALKSGEIDAAEDVPGTRSTSSRRTRRSRRSRATRAR